VNRDTKAIQLKLDELISSTKKARNTFIGLEELTDEELDDLKNYFQKLRDKAVEAKVQRLS
jgi:low affinity Fe/Cu permease